MAERIEAFEVTFTAGTSKAAPATFPLKFNDGVVTELELHIPPGPSGFVGFRLDYGGQQIIPDTPGSFIVANDEVIHWPLSGYPTGAAWQMTGYNTDIYDHTIRARFLIDELPPPPVAPTTIVAIG